MSFLKMCCGNNVIVTSFYRPPDSSLDLFNQKFIIFLQALENRKKKKLVISGDTNIDLLSIDSQSKVNDFFNNLLSFGLLPTITRPTRITDLSSTLIDNIFIDCYDNCSSSSIIYDDISDHLPTLINIDFDTKISGEPAAVESRIFNRNNIDDFINCIKVTDWNFL